MNYSNLFADDNITKICDADVVAGRKISVSNNHTQFLIDQNQVTQ